MAQVLPAEHELRRVIGDGEGVPDREVEGLEEADLLELHRSLVLLRTYDERSVVYHRQGRIGTYAIFWNHEAMQAGSAHALAEGDWIFPSYRESAIGLLRGMPVSTVLHWWRGHPAGWWNPAEYRVASISVPIATHVPHAVGLAWGEKLKGSDTVSIAYFGDGATSEGAFHEGANLAGVMQAPAILFSNNNQWAISTPLSAQTRAETLAHKAAGYGMPGVRLDGGDVRAVYEAPREAVDRDDSVMVMGEDVGRAGGVFRATAGLRDRFGENRCVDTPLAEAGILGSAIGLCMAGWKPVCEMQYDAFSYPCLDQLITHVGRYRWRTGGKMEFPLVVRMPYGGGVRAPELHDDSPEAYYVHTPGVKVAIPSTPADAKGLLAAAIRDPDPVVVLEPKLIYRGEKQEVPEGEHVVPLGQARLAREGTDLTLVAYGAMVPVCERAADALGGEASVEGLDLRSLRPLDEDALLMSAAKTGRVVVVQEAPRTAGFGAEIAAILAEKAILDLQGPVLRVTGFDVPYPYWKIEDRYIPSVERVAAAARKLLDF